MEIVILSDLVIIFGLAIGVLLVCHKMKLPALVGFLVTGALCGPHGLGLVSHVHGVEVMAEIGVVLLLFTIGLELPFSELARMTKPMLVGGGLQVGLTVGAGLAVCSALGLELPQAIFVGFLAALSSTAIVLKLLQDRAQTDTPHGRLSTAVLIFQDLIIVPMMLVAPLLAGQGAVSLPAFLIFTGKALAVLALLLVLAKWVIPWVMARVVATRNRELFLMATLTLCFCIAWLTSGLGLSLSLGAFLAGLMISESEYSVSALDHVLPFKSVFSSLFFVSVGMLLDLDFVAVNLPDVLAIALALILVKTALASGATAVLGYPLRTVLTTGLLLCQVGEFSFILARQGLDLKLISSQGYQHFLAASVLTMLATPFLFRAASPLCRFLEKYPLFTPRRLEPEPPDSGPTDHLIIVGYGLGGRHLAAAAKAAGIDYGIVEINPDTVREEKKRGENIIFGDASQPEVLLHAGIKNARVLAAVIPDPAAVRRIVQTARQLSPSLQIVARTRFASEFTPLKELGADEVVSDEFETSLTLFGRVLTHYLVPREEIERFTEQLRCQDYSCLRDGTPPESPPRMDVSDIDVTAITVSPGSPLDGKTLQESGLRNEHGLTVVAVRRDGNLIVNPKASCRLEASDQAYILGQRADLSGAIGLFETTKKTRAES